MGRRSDHTRPELREMILAEGHRQIAQVGFARFSAREVAKRIGYSIGTLYNVFGSYDQLMLAINGRTLDLWLAFLEQRLADVADRRLAAAISAYFDFAMGHRNAWTALYDFRLPEGEPMPDFYREKVEAITGVIVREIAAALPAGRQGDAPALARSLLATVHGHCFFTLNGTFRVLGETDPAGAALARVEDALARYAG
ncbi:TetR/AcrR family transcriptional regulator [Novosphingobium album (ex Liu et al. 2023)]|uniref:TetR/AcrR family transcriptional regulator n=1 Tax=Novosphingobium album (ex Liu et al. 2023) TaxID=3031130 RepID=A0ABT5WX44_9SPHN|nr:TetR/AcrR family transcriptional regulator [Novosphingobium album (ex Liu et al. 2023)]MDE8654437.1 TetR/AcrR family transcriptional regulator [Novosphingobium album (ex Liu et al. 2023)]